MKKLVYLVAPLMVLPCMMSCNKAPMHKVLGTFGYALSFKTMNDKELKDSSFNEGQDFKFKVKAEANVEHPDQPYSIDADGIIIHIGDATLPLMDGYVVDFTNDDRTEATITISGDKMKADMYVEGIAKKEGHYAYGIVSLTDVRMATGVTLYGWAVKDDTTTGLNLTFEGVDDHKYPDSKSFLFTEDLENFHYDGEPAPDPEENNWYQDHVTWSEDTTAKKSIINIKNIASDYLLIAARSSDTGTFLDTLKWSEIKELSDAGSAPYIFNIGDTKKVKIGKNTYDVRIIDFNHDQNKYGNIAPITFQFVQAISGDAGDYVPSKWNGERNNKNFPGSNLNTIALPDLQEALPEDLKNVLMEVQKIVGVKPNSQWIEGKYDTSLFPLAQVEMTGNSSSRDYDGEGTQYAYWASHEAATDRVVTDINGTARDYWLRSPRTGNTGGVAWQVTAGGTVDGSNGAYVDQADHAVAPAFCI